MRRIAFEEAFSVPGLTTGPSTLLQSMVGIAPDQLTPQQLMVETRSRRLADLTELRIADMDQHGVDMQVLSLATPGIQGIADTGEAVRMARAANDFLAGVVAERPSRFAGLAALPLQDPSAAVAELKRAVRELGLRGALVNGHTFGTYLDAPEMRPVWAALEELDVPLYLHPGAPAQDRWQLLDGYPELVGATWSWGAETAGHALRIVYGGVFDNHPDARLILGHMGEFLPFQLARLNARQQYTMSDKALERMPSEYFGTNIMITTSGVCSAASLVGAMLAIGADNILFAIDYPFEDSGVAVDFLDNAPLSVADREKIAYRNAERILRLA